MVGIEAGVGEKVRGRRVVRGLRVGGSGGGQKTLEPEGRGVFVAGRGKGHGESWQ